MQFISLDEVLAIHDAMIAMFGGRDGMHDFTLLHSAIERPKAQFAGVYLYDTVWLMAAALMHSLVKNHPFDDGNKRTAYVTTARFLYKNGYNLAPAQSEIVTFMVEVDTKNRTIEEIAAWLEKYAEKEISKK